MDKTAKAVHERKTKPYELKNREQMILRNGIWHCSSKDGMKNEVWIPFGDLTVEDFKGYTPETYQQEKGKRMIIYAIEENTSIGVWVPKYPLSIDEETGEVVSVAGAKPAVRKNSNEVEDLCKQYDPANGSKMKTDLIKYLQIARLIKDGRLTWAEIFDNSAEILDDTRSPINVYDAQGSPKKMLPTGGREIQGISDFYGNILEILKHTLVGLFGEDDKAEGFCICGAMYLTRGDNAPVGNFCNYKVWNSELENYEGVGAAVL